MLRLNPRDIWLNPAAALGPKQHRAPGKELCWPWLTAQHSLLVLPVIHMTLILGTIPAHTEISDTRAVLCTVWIWIMVLTCNALIPTGTQVCHRQCLAGGQRHQSPPAGLCSALCSWTCCLTALQWSPFNPLLNVQNHASHLLFHGFMVFSSSAWWPEKLWRQTGLYPFLILCCYSIFLSRYFCIFPPPQLLTAFLLWVNVCSFVQLEAPQCTTAPATQVPHVSSSLAPDFRLLLTLALSLDFSLCGFCDQLEGTGKGNEQNED